LIANFYHRTAIQSSSIPDDFDLLEFADTVLHFDHISEDNFQLLAKEPGVCNLSWIECVEHPQCLVARACFEDVLHLPHGKFDAFKPTRYQDIAFLLGTKSLQHKAFRSCQNLPCQSDSFLALDCLAPIALPLKGSNSQPGETQAFFLLD
jgi:hypothetical protein